MNAVETVKANIRLFTVAYVAWIAATVWLFLAPLPSARTEPDVFGYPRVVACLDVVVHHDRCDTFMNLIAATIALILRAGIVFLAPLLLLFVAAAIFQMLSTAVPRRTASNESAAAVELHSNLDEL